MITRCQVQSINNRRIIILFDGFQLNRYIVLTETGTYVSTDKVSSLTEKSADRYDPDNILCNYFVKNDNDRLTADMRFTIMYRALKEAGHTEIGNSVKTIVEVGAIIKKFIKNGGMSSVG